MGKATGTAQDYKGLVGNFVYRQTKYGTVISKIPKKSEKRSLQQMLQRCQMGNIAANYRLFEGRMLLAFEENPAGLSELNLYIQTNYNNSPVFLTKNERLNGACVVAPYTFCRGSIREVGYKLNSEGVLVTNLSVGDLQISAQTTVAQFANAILVNNNGWEEKDMLTFFYAVQEKNEMSQMPRATMYSWKVVLDLDDDTPLLNVVNNIGFTVINGKLGMSKVLKDAGAAWVHSRDKGNGNIKIGSQTMYVVNEMLANYQTTEAMKRSSDSYGGVNTKKAYLNPNSDVNFSASVIDTGANDENEGQNQGENGGTASGNENENQNQDGGNNPEPGTVNPEPGNGGDDNQGGGGSGGTDEGTDES